MSDIPTPPPAPDEKPPRVLELVWCPTEHRYIERKWVAAHLERVHGVNPTMVVQGYGGSGGRRTRFLGTF